jgi:hypothetical protein
MVLDPDVHAVEELLDLPPDDVDVVEDVELHHLGQSVEGEVGVHKPS